MQQRREAPTTTLGKMRAIAGISLRELERRTKINRGTLSRIERGWQATDAEVAAILEALTRKPAEPDSPPAEASA